MDTFCKSGEFQCFFDDNVSLKCVSKAKTCDGTLDCPFGDDELNCENLQQQQDTQVATSLACLKDEIACWNKETNITECLNIMYFCDSYQKEVFCDNHKDIDSESLKNLCSYYSLSKQSIPFDCGQSMYISNNMVILSENIKTIMN